MLLLLFYFSTDVHLTYGLFPSLSSFSRDDSDATDSDCTSDGGRGGSLSSCLSSAVASCKARFFLLCSALFSFLLSFFFRLFQDKPEALAPHIQVPALVFQVHSCMACFKNIFGRGCPCKQLNVPIWRRHSQITAGNETSSYYAAKYMPNDTHEAMVSCCLFAWAPSPKYAFETRQIVTWTQLYMILALT